MKLTIQILMLFLIVVVAISCDRSDYRNNEKGFRIPQGDVVAGEKLFAELQCFACHSVEGFTPPDDGRSVFEERIPLGGKSYKVTSYGELVTSIIDPNHSIADSYLETLSEDEKKSSNIKSPMVVYNESITVQELIDLAGFLHTKYIVVEQPYSYYYYPYP